MLGVKGNLVGRWQHRLKWELGEEEEEVEGGHCPIRVSKLSSDLGRAQLLFEPHLKYIWGQI